jgi:hypothetical protein
MTQKYFAKFPLITYNNQLAVNITERVVIRDFPSKNNHLYYPYDIQNNERPDQLADRVMNDEYMSWIVYMSNGMTDPYYDWFIPDDAFNDYLVKKYGSLDKIMSRVAYYRNNWYNDTDLITTAEFNSLPDIPKYDAFGKLYFDSAKRYYEVVLTGGNITSYRRKRIDSVISTNKIVRYSIAGTSTFANNEIVSVSLGSANVTTNVYVTSVTGAAQVLASNSTTLTIQHTTGYVDSVPAGYKFTPTNSYVYGGESGSNCTISAISSLANNIVAAESVYWSPVTIYEDEYEKNAKNRTIRLMDPTAADAVAQRASDALAALL